MKNIKTVMPIQCHLWRANLSPDELVDQFKPFKIYSESSHLDRAIMSCKHCGQLYFYEWYEEIDWKHGNDPQYSTWIPVASTLDADRMNELNSLEILKFTPRLQRDFPSEAKEPTAKWIGFKK